MATSTSVVGVMSYFHGTAKCSTRCHNATTYLGSNDYILEEMCLFWVYFVTILVRCVRMEIYVYCLGDSDTYIVVILLETAVFISLTTEYVSLPPKHWTLTPNSTWWFSDNFNFCCIICLYFGISNLKMYPVYTNSFRYIFPDLNTNNAQFRIFTSFWRLFCTNLRMKCHHRHTLVYAYK